MTTVLKTPRPAGRHTRSHKRRSGWRQRLVEAERGVTQGFRSDSTLFVHFFAGSIILATAVVLGLSLVEWAVLVLGLSAVVAAEMFNKVMVEIGRHLPDDSDGSLREGLKIGTAAVFVTIIGTVGATALIFARHVWELFHG